VQAGGVSDRRLIGIGELSRRTGVPVRTIRFYSDIGLLPETERSNGGYRLYNTDAAARLELIRALRELGMDLDTVRQVLGRQRRLSDVARVHAEAIEAQLRVLRIKRSVLRALARSDRDDLLSSEEMKTVYDLARASAEERHRIMTEFLDDIFQEHHNPELEERFRHALPQLPDEPTTEQLDAWVELAELVTDPEFRTWARTVGRPSPHDQVFNSDVDLRAFAEQVAEHSQRAVDSGIDPASPEAAPIVTRIMEGYTAASGEADTPEQRARLADAWARGLNPQAERYWQLIAIINGWPPIPTRTPAHQWFVAALRAHPR